MFKFNYKKTNRRIYPLILEDDGIAHGLISPNSIQNEILVYSEYEHFYRFSGFTENQPIVIEYEETSENNYPTLLIDRVSSITK